MSKLLESLKKYFENAPKEEIEKDWEKIRPLNGVGPDVIEYGKIYKKK